MKPEVKISILITICFLLITLCLWLASNAHTANEKVEALTIQIGDLRQKYYNDSVLVSEYQEALDRYRKIDPLSASDFSRLMEQINNE